ncbi:ankyrin repeat-containing domain protein [Aspergillus californicus]
MEDAEPEFDYSDSPPELDGKSLYTIIRKNDLPQLHKYIASFGADVILWKSSPHYNDPIFVAAQDATPETLRILLEWLAAADLEPAEPFEKQRGFFLLHAACSSANLDTVRFILDTHASDENRLPFGTVDLHGIEPRTGCTPILEAASSLRYLTYEGSEKCIDPPDLHRWADERIPRAEQLIHFLLDRGCLATNILLGFLSGTEAEKQPLDSVLRLAVSRAGRGVIQRLIDQGADIYLKHEHMFDVSEIARFRDGGNPVLDSTTLHIAGQYWNSDIVGLLLDYHRDNSDKGPDLASVQDSHGRLPLHYAAAGPGRNECNFRDEDLTIRIPETIRLLVSAYPAGINIADNTGSTPLHHAVAAHAVCCGSDHAEATIRCLFSHGADPKIPDSRGQTALHILGYNTLHNTPISTTILDLLVTHGIDINAATATGHTALHVFAQNLHQILTARFLVRHGADIRATNVKGDTVFHCMARGIFNSWERPDGAVEIPTHEDRIRAQDATMKLLLEADGADNVMSKRNLEGKTPQEVMQETRNKWLKMERGMKRIGGRGRGRGRGQPS